jgi:gamma-glutamyltranspeptidase
VTAVAIAAPHGLAVDAAREAVSAGGNAVDAALAAAAILAVVYPHQCSLGGDLTALLRRPDGSVEAILSLGAAPAAVDVAALRARGAGMPRQGPDSVTVPGVVAGWTALAAGEARLGLAAALERAAAVAADGVPVADGLRRAVRDRIDAVRADPGLRELLLRDDGEPAQELRQPALADTLAELAGDPGGFYDGALAKRLARGLGALGSPITTEDLAEHEARSERPLVLDAPGVRWWAAPPPAQGATALAMLDSTLPGDLFQRARAAHAARARLLGDPRGGPIDVAGLSRPGAADTDAPPAVAAAGDTVAICAVDDEGRSASLIQSVFQTFGAGLLEPGTGIVLHNRGGAFVLLADPAAHSRHPGRLGPGLRPPHTLCPMLAEGQGMRVALGCQGGRAQPLILAQVGPDTVSADHRLEAILGRPRWVLGDRDLGFGAETLLTEPGATSLSPEDQPDCGPAVVTATGPDDRCGHVSVARCTDGVLDAAADPRADGRAVVVAGPDVDHPRRAA